MRLVHVLQPTNVRLQMGTMGTRVTFEFMPTPEVMRAYEAVPENWTPVTLTLEFEERKEAENGSG